MNTLIVEAGSSKTDSVLLIDGQPEPTVKSRGINPVTDKHYDAAIRELCHHYSDKEHIDRIRYYGSGCINETVNYRIKKGFADFFHRSIDIEVRDDLIAVAHGLCGSNPGIVVIMGTGSNTGYYNGQVITDGYRSCGYLIGDEGSGFRLGQQLIKLYARGLLPKEDQHNIQDQVAVSPELVVSNIYESENPRTSIASWASLLKDCSTAVRQSICYHVFGELIRDVLTPLYLKHQVPIYISGSIAHYFQEELLSVIKSSDIIVPSIATSPLEGLIIYHSHE